MDLSPYRKAVAALIGAVGVAALPETWDHIAALAAAVAVYWIPNRTLDD